MVGHIFSLPRDYTQMQVSASRFLFPGACLLALLLGALIYLPGMGGGFVFDDSTSIASNAAIQLNNLGIHDLFAAALSSPTGVFLRPLSMLSFALDAYFFGLNSFYFKLTNLAIHLACGAMLGCVAYELQLAYSHIRRDPPSRRRIAWMSLGIAVAWLVHPLNLTAVLYTVQRETSLAALFTAAAIYAYLVGRRRQLQLGKGQLLIWLLVPSFGLLGLLCKENAALLPLYLYAVEFTLLGFRGRNAAANKSVHAFFAIFLWLPALAVLTVIAMNPARLTIGYDARDFTLYQRMLTECRILLDYVQWTVLPDVQRLGLFHDDIPISRSLLEPWTTLPCVAAVVLLVAFACLARKRLPLLSLGILWFFAGHVMESSVIPLELVYEHRNYLPIFGLLFGSIATLYSLAGVGRWDRWVALATIAISSVLAITTAMRAEEWSTELSFARFESSHHPGSPRAQAELGWAYMQYILETKDDSLVPQAVAAAEKSRAVDPGSINQDIGLAYMFAYLGQFPQARLHMDRAAEDAKSALPSSTLQLALQTFLVMTENRYKPLLPDMQQVFSNTAANPSMMRNSCYYADIWNTWGMFRYRIMDVPGSLEAMNKAVRLCPKNGLIHANYASMLLSYGETHYAKQEIESLRQLHEMKDLGTLHELEQQLEETERDRETAPSTPSSTPRHGR